MKATRTGPTTYTVEAESCHCTTAGCDVVTGLHFEGEVCPKCAAKGREGKLERRTMQVDLAAFTENGECGCEWFQMNLRGQLLHMSKEERRANRRRCKHIQCAREAAKQDDNLDALLAALPNQEEQT